MIATMVKELLREMKKSRPSSNGIGAEPGLDVRQAAVEWTQFLGRDSALWESARAAAANGPRILLANAYGIDPNVANIESLLAVALTLRGAQVHILMCDEGLPACWASQIDDVAPEEFVNYGPSRDLCKRCFSGAHAIFQSLGLTLHRYSDLITKEESEKTRQLARDLTISEMSRYKLDGLEIGEHVLSGALRYYARGDLEGEPHREAVVRRYFRAGLMTLFATRRLLNMFAFSCVSMLHGIYLPEGVIGEVARRHHVRVVAWSFAYRRKTFIFSQDDSYHRTLLSEPARAWEHLPWTPAMESEITDYLNSRRYGTRDWVRFIEQPQENIGAIAAELGVDFTKPCVGLLTNVVWDAQLSYRNTAFGNMMEWVLQTVRYFAHRPELQLIIRVHPGELLADTRARQTVMGELGRAIPRLPSNVFVIAPESTISTYTLMDQCNAVIIYGTKTGVEITSMGIPVIVAGEAWIRNKGVTLDAGSADEYFQLLDKLPLKGRLSEHEILRARKYAYHFFFRRLIPLPVRASGLGLESQPDVATMNELLPGQHAGLDVICNGILTGSDFIYPAEKHTIGRENGRPATPRALAQRSLRVADWLGRLGEFERMRAQLLKTVRECPSVINEPWAESSIAKNASRLALAADKPVANLDDVWTDIRATAGERDFNRRFTKSPLLARALVEIAIASCENGAYGRAGWATVNAFWRDPGQLMQRSVLKRFARTLAGSHAEFISGVIKRFNATINRSVIGPEIHPPRD